MFRATMRAMTRLFVEQRRGFAVEAVHAVHAVSCASDGSVRVLSGSDVVTTFRSAAKPFQLEIAHDLLRAEVRAALDLRDLALGTASQHGEPAHLAALGVLLSKLGCRESDLLCGAHPPLDAASAEALWARGERPSALHNNCSGKHAFMAAAARTQGYPHDYRPASHPLQQALRARLGTYTDGAVRGTVVDGCGVPSFVLPLSAMARAYARLACETAGGPTTTLGRIGAAMRAAPRLVSGSTAFDGWLMEHSDALAKVGALGLLCIALPVQGLGIAIKIESGSELARPVAVEAVLARVLPGLLTDPLPDSYRLVTNVVGAEVGAIVTRPEAD